MFTKKKEDVGPSPELATHWQENASRPAPLVYSRVGSGSHRPSRQAVYCQATATLEGGEVLPVIIRNLSETGCRIEFFRQLPLGGRVLVDELSIPLHFWAEVVWRGDGAAGLQIVDPDTSSGGS